MMERLSYSSLKKTEKNFEERYGSLQKAAEHFMNQNDKKFLKENTVEVKFNKYNWQLNTQ